MAGVDGTFRSTGLWVKKKTTSFQHNGVIENLGIRVPWSYEAELESVQSTPVSCVVEVAILPLNSQYHVSYSRAAIVVQKHDHYDMDRIKCLF